MKPVERNEIVDYVTYEERREAFRADVLKAKAVRRVHVGEYLTLLFENRLTVQYQIQEMIRTERVVKEADIIHEIKTYNELLGAEGELGCTLLIEIEDVNVRAEKLKSWVDLPDNIYLKFEDGDKALARIDERQREEGKLSSVQFLKFDTKGRVPIVVGVDYQDQTAETVLSEEQRNALSEDLYYNTFAKSMK
jgi:hypothetical protein